MLRFLSPGETGSLKSNLSKNFKLTEIELSQKKKFSVRVPIQ
jgi:hypothetical protein